MARVWVGRQSMFDADDRAMGFNHHRGQVLSDAGAFDVLLRAIELGCTFWDTASIYGYGANEELIGRFFKAHPGSREKVFLASKCGLEVSKHVVSECLSKPCRLTLLTASTWGGP
jgi:aryl-alcohol dehydrogenase-like predicted oxidoreductase